MHLHELAISEAQGESTFQHVVANDGYSGIKRRRYERPDEQVVESPSGSRGSMTCYRRTSTSSS